MAKTKVLLAQLIERPQEDPYERRVLANGTYEERTSVKTEFVDGEMKFSTKPLRWAKLADLNESDLKEVAAAIERAHFAELAGEHRPEGTAIGGSNVTWTAAVAGTTEKVVLRAAPATARAELDQLAKDLDRIATKAMDRARKA